MANTDSCISSTFQNPLLTSVKTSKPTSEQDPSWNTTALQSICLPEYVVCVKGRGEDKGMRPVISQSNLNIQLSPYQEKIYYTQESKKLYHVSLNEFRYACNYEYINKTYHKQLVNLVFTIKTETKITIVLLKYK